MSVQALQGCTQKPMSQGNTAPQLPCCPQHPAGPEPQETRGELCAWSTSVDLAPTACLRLRPPCQCWRRPYSPSMTSRLQFCILKTGLRTFPSASPIPWKLLLTDTKKIISEENICHCLRVGTPKAYETELLQRKITECHRTRGDGAQSVARCF